MSKHDYHQRTCLLFDNTFGKYHNKICPWTSCTTKGRWYVVAGVDIGGYFLRNSSVGADCLDCNWNWVQSQARHTFRIDLLSEVDMATDNLGSPGLRNAVASISASRSHSATKGTESPMGGMTAQPMSWMRLDSVVAEVWFFADSCLTLSSSNWACVYEARASVNDLMEWNCRVSDVSGRCGSITGKGNAGSADG